MCGIAGFIKLSEQALVQESDITHLKQMGAQLKLRGPDEERIYTDACLGLAFTRLSIVDIAGGMQPFHNEDNSIILAVNGEIFNHQALRQSLKSPYPFKSNSDCEVLLPLYQERGLDFLQDVNGMFGLVIWDKHKKRLILARDRLGIKPMYYCQLPRQLLFGSELKALFAHPDCPKQICWDDIFHYATLNTAGNIPSFFSGISNLPAGNLLIVDLVSHEIKEKKYWDITRPSDEEYASDHRSEIEIIEQYQHILCDSVQLNLMSDVPVGLFLSGGIDSASIAAISAKHKQLQTFTILSQSTFTNEDARYGPTK